MLANLSAASPFASNYPPLALSGCLLLLGDPSELLGVLLKFGTVDREGLFLGQVSALLEEAGDVAQPTGIRLVEALSVVVSGLAGDLLVRGLTIVKNNQGPLDPSLVGGEVGPDLAHEVLELDRLSALGAAHVLTVAFRELEDNQASKPRKGHSEIFVWSAVNGGIHFDYLNVVDEKTPYVFPFTVRFIESRPADAKAGSLERWRFLAPPLLQDSHILEKNLQAPLPALAGLD